MSAKREMILLCEAASSCLEKRGIIDSEKKKNVCAITGSFGGCSMCEVCQAMSVCHFFKQLK